MKKLIEKLEALLELGDIKKDVTLLALSGAAVICSLCGVRIGGLLEELTVAKERAWYQAAKKESFLLRRFRPETSSVSFPERASRSTA